MILAFGAVGILFLAGVIALAVFLQPAADETGDSSPQERSAPAKKPPLN